LDKQEIFDVGISDVSTTLLLTLYSHALESRSEDPILNDPKAEEIVANLNKELEKSNNRLYQRLVKGKLNKSVIVHISIRAKKYDEYVQNFLKKWPTGVIVNIGCGLDTRFWRIDNGKTNFYDLDLPEVIEIKKKLCKEDQRYHMLPFSVLDYKWMNEVLEHNSGPFIFVAEGIFMYLSYEDVKELVLQLQKEFPGSELVCEVFNDFWLHNPWKRLLDFKMQKEFKLGSGATFKSGLKTGKEMENWGHGIEFIDEWSYFDSNEKKLGWLKLLGKIDSVRKTQWTVHYKLNQ
jgi:methyltransferase (TIGR00027 family)